MPNESGQAPDTGSAPVDPNRTFQIGRRQQEA